MNELGRPTASIHRVDVSSERSGASAVPAVFTEADLFRGYASEASHLETRPCQCGGLVTADVMRPAPGVAAHQFTSRHRGWRLAQDAA